MKKLNKKGFTLVELLLVIAIIGILAAVLFVSLGSQRERARITAFKEQMRALVPSVTTCLDDGGNLLTTAGGDICDTGGNHGQYLPAADMKDCTGGAATYDATLATAADPVSGTANAAITANCTTSSGVCTATCGASGCTYSAGCN